MDETEVYEEETVEEPNEQTEPTAMEEKEDPESIRAKRLQFLNRSPSP